jgi:signal transduction histidine kinase
MSRTPEPDSAALSAGDRRRVQRSAVRVGLWVGLASAAVVGAIVAIIVAVSVAASRPDPDHDHDGFGGPGGPGGPPPSRVIDLGTTVALAIALGVVGVIALGVLAWWMSRRATRPLAEALQAQRAFVADASHELRTPLTALISRIQLAQHRADRGGDVAGALTDLRRDAEVMNAVLTDLLLAAEAAGGHSADDGAVASVASVAREAVAVIQLRADAAQVPVTIDVESGLDAAADATALTRALIALLDNAVRHSEPGDEVSVTARAIGGRVELRVTDHGSGIEGDPERLFERFARGSTGEDAVAPHGFGLGLALVRDTVTRFGGTVRVEHTSTRAGDHGTVFLLALRVANPAS